MLMNEDSVPPDLLPDLLLPTSPSCQGAVGVRGPVRGCPLRPRVVLTRQSNLTLSWRSLPGRVYASGGLLYLGGAQSTMWACNFLSEQLSFSAACLSHWPTRGPRTDCVLKTPAAQSTTICDMLEKADSEPDCWFQGPQTSCKY